MMWRMRHSRLPHRVSILAKVNSEESFYCHNFMLPNTIHASKHASYLAVDVVKLLPLTEEHLTSREAEDGRFFCIMSILFEMAI